MNPDSAARLREATGREVGQVRSLAENKYCDIFEGWLDDQRAVFKIYKSGKPDLVVLEGGGIDIYHSIAAHSKDLVDSKVLILDPEKKLIAISFVEGGRLADHVRMLAKNPGRWAEGEALMMSLGRFLRAMRDQTMQRETAIDPFHEEYLVHCSRRLRSLPIVGGTLFKAAEPEAIDLYTRFVRARPTVSMAHGDFVLRNVHVDGSRVGIIDFANTLRISHPLNDLYNMRQGIENMLLPASFRRCLWESLRAGYGSMDFAEVEHEFFHEFHRRRWLMLNLAVRQPIRWVRSLRGMRSFARPWVQVRDELLS